MTQESPERAEEEPRADGHERLCILMRGLPGSGKSHRAQRLAGAAGVVCETDAYFREAVAQDAAGTVGREELIVRCSRGIPLPLRGSRERP